MARHTLPLNPLNNVRYPQNPGRRLGSFDVARQSPYAGWTISPLLRIAKLQIWSLAATLASNRGDPLTSERSPRLPKLLESTVPRTRRLIATLSPGYNKRVRASEQRYPDKLWSLMTYVINSRGYRLRHDVHMSTVQVHQKERIAISCNEPIAA
ncbi:hypothetical protein K474DRAFT_370410 [Panus rudis PR-1116 ss-1]|nr:hypothetical protein K474DRAFT_370410 [Panus rudis PR-1116 ss-1]